MAGTKGGAKKGGRIESHKTSIVITISGKAVDNLRRLSNDTGVSPTLLANWAVQAYDGPTLFPNNTEKSMAVTHNPEDE